MTQPAADRTTWPPGSTPIAVVMISLNEAHNMDAVLRNLRGWAQEVFLVDSFSADETVQIALQHGVHVVQRSFQGFGDQWNFALRTLPVTTPWTMKLDPDERLTPALKSQIDAALPAASHAGYEFPRRLYFMGKGMPARDRVLRVWRTGKCRFSDVRVNEHPIVEGSIGTLDAEIEHHDSPSLEHWFNKQNLYTSAEAESAYEEAPLSAAPKLTGSRLERRMWLKTRLRFIPGRYILLWLYHAIWLGAWKAGRRGLIWSRLRVLYFRMIEDKLHELRIHGGRPVRAQYGTGKPHPDAIQAND